MKPKESQGRSDIADVTWRTSLVEKRRVTNYDYFEMNTSALAVLVPGLALMVAACFWTIPLAPKIMAAFLMTFGVGLLLVSRRRLNRSPVVARALTAQVQAGGHAFTLSAYHGRGAGPDGMGMPYPYMLASQGEVYGGYAYPDEVVERALSSSLDVFTAAVVASEFKDFFNLQAVDFPVKPQGELY